jgi:hypothetical protein
MPGIGAIGAAGAGAGAAAGAAGAGAAAGGAMVFCAIAALTTKNDATTIAMLFIFRS